MIIRFMLTGFFSLTAITLMGYQLIEIVHAYSDLFHKN